jgi:hypothetical protein
MEIIDYLRVARRRIWILVLVPLIAAAVTVGIVVQRPSEYSATATVSTVGLVGGSTSQFTGPQAINQFVAAFSASANGPAVLSAAAKRVHLPIKELGSGLTVTQNGASSNMSIHYLSDRESDVSKVLSVVVNETMKSLFSSQVTVATQRVSDAKAAVDTTNQALVNLGDKYHVADPTLLYQAKLGQLNWLLQRQAFLQTSGRPSAAAEMAPSITAIRDDLRRFHRIIPQYNNLNATEQAQVSNLSAAQDAYRTAVAQLRVAESGDTVFISAAKSVGRQGSLLRTLVPVIGLGILLAIAAVVVLELLLNTRRSFGRYPKAQTGATSSEPVP